ncbi:MAG: hypothetical protein HY402_07290, partial [Elusimicrobia bacterium]|nr:hypothetical protein [Elusimicrobiota bacterium]
MKRQQIESKWILLVGLFLAAIGLWLMVPVLNRSSEELAVREPGKDAGAGWQTREGDASETASRGRKLYEELARRQMEYSAPGGPIDPKRTVLDILGLGSQGSTGPGGSGAEGSGGAEGSLNAKGLLGELDSLGAGGESLSSIAARYGAGDKSGSSRSSSSERLAPLGLSGSRGGSSGAMVALKSGAPSSLSEAFKGSIKAKDLSSGSDKQGILSPNDFSRLQKASDLAAQAAGLANRDGDSARFKMDQAFSGAPTKAAKLTANTPNAPLIGGGAPGLEKNPPRSGDIARKTPTPPQKLDEKKNEIGLQIGMMFLQTIIGAFG